MSVCGIISEYNPYHLGHEYQLIQAKAQSKADIVLVVMSGMFMQRGQCAITSKYNRANMALSQGADIVIELPTMYALQSAEYFALGSVGILDALGVDYISYGTEAKTKEQRNVIKEFVTLTCKSSPDKIFEKKIKEKIKLGLSYPQARLEAFEEITTNKKAAQVVLKSPNAILEIAYLSALNKLKSQIAPIPIPRIGDDYHSDTPHSNIASASAIRNMIYKNIDYSAFMPKISYKILNDTLLEDKAYDNECFYNILINKIVVEPDILDEIPDGSDELKNRILKAIPISNSFNELVDNIQTRRYTRARISRALFHIILNIRHSDVENLRKYLPLYARVLGVNKDKKDIIGQLYRQAKIDIITSPAKYIPSSQLHEYMFNKDISASNAYYMATNNTKNFNRDFWHRL